MEFFEKAEVGTPFYEVYQSNMVDHDYKKVSEKHAFKEERLGIKLNWKHIFRLGLLKMRLSS